MNSFAERWRGILALGLLAALLLSLGGLRLAEHGASVDAAPKPRNFFGLR